MRRYIFVALAIGAGLAMGPAVAGSKDELGDALKGRVAGKRADCVNTSQLGGPQIVGNTLVYRDGARLWVTEVIGQCPGLTANQTIVTELWGGQMCRNDRFRTLTPGLSIPGPYCRVGGFTPYVKVKPAS